MTIYLDNNAATPMLPLVVEAMLPYFTEQAGNPASSHQAGRRARRALEDAREQCAFLLGAHPDEVFFTSGATEANNLALLGLAGSLPGRILASLIEHPCVVEPIQHLARQGFQQTLLPIEESGHVVWNEYLFTPDTRLAAVMLANHETGAIQPILEIADRLGERAPLHCDAAAAAGKIPIDFHALGTTTLTVSAHKFFGPKGIGALLVRRCTKISPLLFGGHQQQGKRPGTEPVALAVGLARALAWCLEHLEANRQKLRVLRELFLKELEPVQPLVNGPPAGEILSTLNLSFPGCRAEALVMALDLVGVACSTGSACSSGSMLASPVLKAMGLKGDRLHSAVRFSFSPLQSESEIAEAAARICKTVLKLRDWKTTADEELFHK